MKGSRLFVMMILFALPCCPVYGNADWVNDCIEESAAVQAASNTLPAQSQARRAASLALQDRLIDAIRSIQLNSEATIGSAYTGDDFRNDLLKVVRNLEITSGIWKNTTYTIHGRIAMNKLRALTAGSNIQQKPASRPNTGKGYTGLLIDVRHLNMYKPAMIFNVYDTKGKLIYGAQHINRSHYINSGFAGYSDNYNQAVNDERITPRPAVVKAVSLGRNNVDIIISAGESTKIISGPYDFRREGRVIVVKN